MTIRVEIKDGRATMSAAHFAALHHANQVLVARYRSVRRSLWWAVSVSAVSFLLAAVAIWK